MCVGQIVLGWGRFVKEAMGVDANNGEVIGDEADGMLDRRKREGYQLPKV